MVDICYPEGTDWGCSLNEAEIAALNPELKARAEALAWSTLSALTAYRVALCPTILRPCAARCLPPTYFAAPVVGGGWGTDTFSPYMLGGSWYNGCGCSGIDSCSCSRISEVYLPSAVGSVDRVIVDGEVLPPTAYRIDNFNRLVRQDGGAWPLCQDMSVPVEEVEPFVLSLGDTGTLTITREGDVVRAVGTDWTGAHPFLPSQDPEAWLPLPQWAWPIGPNFISGLDGATTQWLIAPAAAIPVPDVPDNDWGVVPYYATGTPAEVVWITNQPDTRMGAIQESTFAVEYYSGIAPNDLLRYAAGLLAYEYYKACGGEKCRLPQGVTSITRNNITMEIPSGLFPSGATGIHQVDTIIRIYNPHGLKTSARVLSPDRPTGRITTGA